MRSPLRIAILECDEPMPEVKEKYGGYGDIFKDLLQRGAKMLAHQDHGMEPALEVTKFDVVNTEQYPKLEDVDALLLTGSSMALH